MKRHDALRTRIVRIGEIPMQEVAGEFDGGLGFDDLTDVAENCRAAEVSRRLDRLIMQPMDLATGPLFEARLLKLRRDEHVLLVAMEHSISDGYSLSIVLGEILTAYSQAIQGVTISLPAVSTQFADYALWQRNRWGLWLKEHAGYWDAFLRDARRLRFPVDHVTLLGTRPGWGIASLRIDRELKTRLSEWCRLRRTTLVMGVFTAYVAAVLRWCEAEEGVFQYQSDGRATSRLENSVGFFATTLYLQIRLLGSDSFADLLSRVTEEYCSAYEHADYSYFASQMPRPEFTRGPSFNWLPCRGEIEPSDLHTRSNLIATPVPFLHPMLRSLDVDHEPWALFTETDEDIVGEVYYPRSRFSPLTMEGFCRNLMLRIRALQDEP